LDDQFKTAQKIRFYKERQLKVNIHEEMISKLREAGHDVSQYKLEKLNTTIPDYLMCPLKLDFMDEPVVLSSGFTYEKDDIERHFAQNGKTDPLTREQVDDKLIAN
jgi:hypothetical protein